MNPDLRKKFDKLRTLPHSGSEGLADFFKKEGIRFVASDMPMWTQFLAARFGRSGGTLHFPEWLAGVFAALGKNTSPSSICDPWAGTGFLLEVMRDACQPREALAITQLENDYSLGQVLVPQVKWHLGQPLQFLESTTQTFDLVASIPPFNLRPTQPVKVAMPSGGQVELRDGLGGLIVAASALRLTSSGIGLFVVPPSFFYSHNSVFRQLGIVDLGVQAAFALPPGTFAPYTNIPAYLLVIRRNQAPRMFVAQLTSDAKTNLPILDNSRQQLEGGTLNSGRFVDPASFVSLGAMRAREQIEEAERSFGVAAIKLSDLATAINLGRSGTGFSFEALDNALYVPIIGLGDVAEARDALKLKAHNYAQIVIDPARSSACFISRFLNSSLGRDIRQRGMAGIAAPRFNKQALRDLPVIVPDLQTQQTVLGIDAQMMAEENTLLGLQNELAEFRRELWNNPHHAADIDRRLTEFSKPLRDHLNARTDENLDQWFSTLPFPLASILRSWRATQPKDFKTKYELLLHFFEATAQFVAVVFLSAFRSNSALFAEHAKGLAKTLQALKSPTFGTWIHVVEYLGSRTRALLVENGKKPSIAEYDRGLCAELFFDRSMSLPTGLSDKGLLEVLKKTNAMRNAWAHGGFVGQAEAQSLNEGALAEVQRLRESMQDLWRNVELIQGSHSDYYGNFWENEVSVLMSSEPAFLTEHRQMTIPLQVARLYLKNKSSMTALQLLPFIRIGPSPQTANTACYFFNKLVSQNTKDGGEKYVAWHFADASYRDEPRGEVYNVIEALTQGQQD
jgi:hypothetical protein